MTGDPRKLPEPPKYGPKGPMPTSLADWVSFFRWLVSLWAVASVSISAQESIAITPRSNPAGADQETLGAAQAFNEGRPAATKLSEADAAAIQAFRQIERRGLPDELTAVGLMGMTKVPYPLHNNPVQTTSTLEDLHSQRGSAGSLTVAGSTLTWVSGTKFTSNMVSQLIAIDFILFRVASYSSPTSIAVVGTPTAGAHFFLYTKCPSSQYVQGSFFVELDRDLLYVSEESNGTVDTNGTALTWVGGNNFYPYWAQGSPGAAPIVISGVSYRIVNFTSATTAVLQSSAGVQSGVPYTVASGKWQYVSGQYADILANVPTDIGLYDEGLLFFDTTYWHLMRWNESALSFQFAPGDSGSGYIVAAGSVSAGIWVDCDGTTQTISAGDGTTRNVVTPNLTGEVFIKGASAQGSPQAAFRATWEPGAKTDDAVSEFQAGAVTEPEDTHVHNINPPSQEVQAGTGISVAADSGFLSGPGSAHQHGITTANAPQELHKHDLSNANAKLYPPDETHGGMPYRISLRWYMRQ